MARGFEVKPKSHFDIREIALALREAVGYTAAYFSIAHFIDLEFSRNFPECVFHVAEEEELGERHGETIPDLKVLKVRNDVYIGAHEGNGRDRFTMAHELGHFFLHRNVALARREGGAHPVYCDSEWQADTFAAELLMAVTHISIGDSPLEIERRFGVSRSAAVIRWNQLRKEGLV